MYIIHMRIVQIILADLTAKKLKAEEELQRCINDKVVSVDLNTDRIEDLLLKIVNIDLMVEKWSQYTSAPADNNNNNNDK